LRFLVAAPFPHEAHGSCSYWCRLDVADDVDGVVSGEVEQELELGGKHRGCPVVLDRCDVQSPVIDSEDVSDDQVSGADSH